MSKTRDSKDPSKHVKKYQENDEQQSNERNEQTFKCKCGKIFLTKQQLKCHKRSCDIVCGEINASPEVNEDLCEEWRSMAKNGLRTTEIQEEYKYSGNAIRTHLRGDCSHSDSNLEYEVSKKKWVEDGNQTVKECECGKEFLTSKQLNSHKANCDEVGNYRTNTRDVPQDMCTEWRKKLGQYDSLPEMAEDTSYSVYAVRKHIRGDCSHDKFDVYWEYNGRHWKAREK